MNVVFWILQVLLAAHTVFGAVWKFSHSEKAVPSLGAIPHPLWLALGVLEFFIAGGLVAPAVSRSLALLAPVAALYIVGEMLLYTGVHLASGTSNHGQLIYWLAVTAIGAVIAWGRFVVRPL